MRRKFPLLALNIDTDAGRVKIMNRRTFLRLAALAGIGVVAAFIHRSTAPVGPLTYLRWMARGKKQRFFGKPSIVALGECSSYDTDLFACLRNLWKQAEMPGVRDKRILIKPNLIDFIENYPITTAPEVVGAVAEVLFERGAREVTVGDGSGFRREAWPIVEASGLAEVLAARRLKFVDLNYDDPQPVPVRDKWLRRSSVFWLPRHVINSDLIISVPKLKSHHWSRVSLSLKNLFGVVPGARYGWPKNTLHINGIPQSILGIYQLLPPVVAVVDGIVGMEGDGPLFGRPVPHGLLAVGRDPVSVDVTCAQLMGFSAESIQHLALAAWAGIGQARRIEIRGVPRERLQRKYQPPPSFEKV
jgi:uncharacterized protein (DUF362 family)